MRKNGMNRPFAKNGGSAMKILVVYATRSGTCKMVAERVGKEMNADVEQLADLVNRKGIFGFMLSGFQATAKRCSPLGPLTHDPADYDLTIVVSPIWAGTYASPIRTFLRDYGKKMKEAAFLVLHMAPKDQYLHVRNAFEAEYGKKVKAFDSLCVKDGPERLQTEVDLFLRNLV